MSISNWGMAFFVMTTSVNVFASPAPAVQSGWRPHQSNPYSGLFQPDPLVKPFEVTQATAPATPAKPKVVCGMTVIPVDPSPDPEFTKTPPDRSTKFTMRLIEPPICKP